MVVGQSITQVCTGCYPVLDKYSPVGAWVWFACPEGIICNSPVQRAGERDDGKNKDGGAGDGV
ncbi:MAG: hypothetical protein D3910_26470 [Candidatus Electrothrix sp. ATG2]|nr:hypothetical protein [Candidatus Electrothrix sp. ATG2]